MLFQSIAEKMSFALKNITITGNAAQPQKFLTRKIGIPIGRTDESCRARPTKTTGANWERSLAIPFVGNFGCIDFQRRRFDVGVTYCQLNYPQNSFSGSFPAIFKSNIARSSTYCGICAVCDEHRHSDFFAMQQQPCSFTEHDRLSPKLCCSSLPAQKNERWNAEYTEPPFRGCVPVW